MVINCIFSGNAAKSGGGIFNHGSMATITNCTFKGKKAPDSDGGGLYNEYEEPAITSCTFDGKPANEDGGGIFNHECGSTITNCTLAGNTAQHGGRVYNFYVPATIGNCILVGNKGGEIYNCGTPTVAVVTYSDVRGVISAPAISMRTPFLWALMTSDPSQVQQP
jgi:hypothetical protein